MGDELLFQEGMLHFYYLRFAIDVVPEFFTSMYLARPIHPNSD
jgi:hypothetical protein